MIARKYCIFACLAWVVATLWLCPSIGRAATQVQPTTSDAGERKPNIIVILADDLGYGDLSCFGQKQFTTPRLDRMAEQGMKLTSHYAASPVCLPSRYSMLTGLHQGHAYIRGNRWNLSMRPDPDDLTVATLLNSAGYATALIGKSGVGHDGDPQIVLDKGFDYFFGYTSHGAAHRQYPRELWRGTERVQLDGNTGYDGTQYAGDLFVEDATTFIKDHADEPFFVQLSLTQPHPDLAAPQEYLDRYRGRFDEPRIRANQRPKQPQTRGYLFTETPKADYAAMIAWTDDAVGRVLGALAEAGIDDNTIVLFTSDNGPPKEGQADPDYFDSNGIYRGWKRDVYDGGIRVPTIVRWPAAIPPGSESDHPSYFPDYLPTFCEAAGAPVPGGLDGVSFLPTLTGHGEQASHDYLYWEFHERGGRQALRRGDWKAVRLNVLDDPDGPIELYHLAGDPGETTDVAVDHPKVAAELTELMAGAREASSMWRWGAKEND